MVRTIATSIAPRNLELQQDAIATWMKLGFDVISVNSGEEINLIKEHFSGVKFVKADRNALPISGKPYIYFDDILHVLESTGAQICGIVNSDIYLFADENLIDFIVKGARDGFVFGSRIDISSLNSLIGEEYFKGFDYFFFSRDIIKTYLQSDFCLGVPWWDYWAPLVPIIKGFPVKQLITPFAYHIQHPTRWSSKYYKYYGIKFLDYLMREDILKHTGNDLRAIIDANNKNLETSLLSIKLLGYINKKTTKLSYHDSSELSCNKNISYQEYLKIRDELTYYKNRQKSFEKSFEELAVDFYSSWSWRITAPLRWIFEKLK